MQLGTLRRATYGIAARCAAFNLQSMLSRRLNLPPVLLLDFSRYAALTIKWLNDNQGLVSAGIFCLTLFLGWASGIFSALRRKPKFICGLIPGPTFACIFPTGEQFNGHDVYRIGFALYLSVANCGSAASSLHAVHIGYRWNVIPLTKIWFRKTLLRHWLQERTASLTDFQVVIGSNVKVYPFMFQRNFLSSLQQETFLQSGQSVVGIVYFEQSDSWGGSQPRVWKGRVRLSVRLLDVFGGRHTRSFWIPALSLEEARKFNPSFGRTLSALHGKPLPGDDSS
jgi:hypothetical protein